MLDGKQREQDRIHKIVQGPGRTKLLQEAYIAVNIIENPINSLVKSSLVQIGHRTHSNWQRMPAMQDCLRFKHECHAGLAAIRAPHGQAATLFLIRAVLGYAGQIGTGNQCVLAAIEISKQMLPYGLSPVQPLRQLLDALPALLIPVDSMIQQLDAIIDLTVIIHAGRTTHP